MADSESLFFFPRMGDQQHPQLGAGPSSSSSQNLVRHRNNLSTFSLSSHVSLPNRVSTLEAYELIYGEGPTSGAAPAEAVERLYEANASAYENPLITASSRQIIGDINALSRQLRELDVPRPLAMFKTLFRPSQSRGEAGDSWFQALRVWSEIDEVYDSESFDGHRLSIIEHTLNILVFPGLHSDVRGAGLEHIQSDSSSVLSLPTLGGAGAPRPALGIPGLRRLPLPSPFHLKLHVISRLSFNEQGRITRHRDFCDVRDVLGLVPGFQAAQWVGSRGLAWAACLAGWALRARRKDEGLKVDDNDVERGEAASAHALKTDASGVNLNALGLHFNESSSGSSIFSRAALFAAPRRTSVVSVSAGRIYDPPDVDREPHEGGPGL